MANPLFGVVAACRLDITAGSSSRAAYFALVAQYQFGTPIIYGRAPAELATAIGVPLYSQVGDPGIQATVPGVVVVSFPNPTPSVVVGGVAYPVSTAVGGGTLVGVNYVDPNGVLHPDVDWQWQISVEPYQQGASTGGWQQQIVQWVGDGTSARAIPTTFPLNVAGARVAIWVFEQDAFDIASFRHNAMPGTSYSTSPVSLVGGVMSFDAGGFTVTNDAVLNVWVNRTGKHYHAIVLCDTTTDFRYMQVGGYPIWPPTDVVNAFSLASNIVLGNTGSGVTGITPENVGQPVVAGTGPMIVQAYVDASHWIYGGGGPLPSPDAGHPQINLEVVGTPAARTIQVPNAGQLTQLWIFNRAERAPFCSSDLPVGQSISLGLNTAASNNNITRLGVGQFDIGTDDASNGSNQGHYYFVAFTIPGGSPVRALFTTFSAVGNGGSVPVAVGFLPGFVASRPITPGSLSSVWRGPWHTGTTSTRFDQTALPTDGITALTATGFTMGTEAAPNGVAIYGFALAASGAVVAAGPFSPTTPPPYNPGGPGVPLPTPAAGGAGCSTDVAPGTATDAGTTGCAR